MSDLAAMIERTRARGEAGQRERAATAATMREKHPDFAAFVDDYRRVFGARLVMFREKDAGGYEWEAK